MTRSAQKRTGSYFTPDRVVTCLVRWAVRSETDALLDPSCGDGPFTAAHRNSVGIEQDRESAATLTERATPSNGPRARATASIARQAIRRSFATSPSTARCEGEPFDCARRRGLCSQVWLRRGRRTLETVGPHGIRCARRNWTRTLCFAAPKIPGRPLRHRSRCRYPGKAVPAAVRGLLAALRRWLRRLDRRTALFGGRRLRAFRPAAQPIYPGGGSQMERGLEPSHPTVLDRERRPRTLPRDGIASGIEALRRGCDDSDRIRQRNERFLPSETVPSRVAEYPRITVASDGPERPGPACPRADCSDGGPVDAGGSSRTASQYPETSRCTAIRPAVSRHRNGPASQRRLQMPNAQTLVFGA